MIVLKSDDAAVHGRIKEQNIPYHWEQKHDVKLSARCHAFQDASFFLAG